MSAPAVNAGTMGRPQMSGQARERQPEVDRRTPSDWWLIGEQGRSDSEGWLAALSAPCSAALPSRPPRSPRLGDVPAARHRTTRDRAISEPAVRLWKPLGHLALIVKARRSGVPGHLVKRDFVATSLPRAPPGCVPAGCDDTWGVGDHHVFEAGKYFKSRRRWKGLGDAREL